MYDVYFNIKFGDLQEVCKIFYLCRGSKVIVSAYNVRTVCREMQLPVA